MNLAKDWPLTKVRNKALAALKEHGVRITSICGDAQAALAFLAPKIITHVNPSWQFLNFSLLNDVIYNSL